ncbi:MAG: 50S ribosomal protein L10 [Anaerolineae bacterium]
MALSRERKDEILGDLEEMLGSSQALLMTDYRGMAVGQMQTIRNRLSELDCTYQVVKNRLVRLAMDRAGVEYVPSLFDGPTAIGFCQQDVVGPAQALVAYAKETKLLTVRGGLMGDRVLDQLQVEEIASLPTRDELVGRMMSRLQAPLYGLAYILSEQVQGLLRVVMARARELEGTSEST